MKADQAVSTVNRLRPVGCHPPGRNHSLDRQRTGQITRKRDPGLDEEIGVTNSGEVMRAVSMTCPGQIDLARNRLVPFVSEFLPITSASVFCGNCWLQFDFKRRREVHSSQEGRRVIAAAMID